MPPYPHLLIRRAPFLRLIPCFMAGILFQWYFGWSKESILILFLSGIFALLSFFVLPLLKRFQFSIISGAAVAAIFFSLGAFICYQKNIHHSRSCFGRYLHQSDAVIVSLAEPLAEKTKTFKANATVQFVLQNGKMLPVKGTVIVYFKKDSLQPALEYGSRIIFKKSLEEINNAGNPGGFDYKRYTLFQGITHQVFLNADEYEILPGKVTSWFKNFIFSSRESVLNILRTYIPNQKELGLAEALLIGYKNDLEQSLVQSYTNTGVVHIIAISGLHLGLIYWLLGLLTKPFKRNKKLRWLTPVVIISGLWLFTFLAGAQASILRSAVMFTCIVLGQSIGRKDNSIYNTLALSALILLCINPYWLWDVGFQLSYAAVLSIVIFMRPIYNWFYFKNKILDFIWKLNAITLAAQILTVPLSIYHFHQFPNYFLLTNLLAVPISSIILLGEIFLCAIAFIPAVAVVTGKVIQWLILVMNTWIENIESLRFSLWDGLQISLIQTLLLFVCIAGFGFWLLEQSKFGLKTGLLALVAFAALRTVSFFESNNQHKIIVYNVPQHQAIDFVQGRNYQFVGDSALQNDGFLRNFHLKPSRILHRMSFDDLPGFFIQNNYFQFSGKKILLIDDAIKYEPAVAKTEIDLLIFSKNPKVYISKLISALNIRQVVFDGSCPAWKLKYWKRDCDSLGIPYFDVAEKGAFVMSL